MGHDTFLLQQKQVHVIPNGKRLRRNIDYTFSACCEYLAKQGLNSGPRQVCREADWTNDHCPCHCGGTCLSHHLSGAKLCSISCVWRDSRCVRAHAWCVPLHAPSVCLNVDRKPVPSQAPRGVGELLGGAGSTNKIVGSACTTMTARRSDSFDSTS